MATFHINSFVRRQTPESPYSHFEGTDEQLLQLLNEWYNIAPRWTQGYREGVILVEVQPDGFYTGLVELRDGDTLVGEFKSRREGETPRMSINVEREGERKQPATRVQLVCYAHNVLAEDNDNETDADFELISINAYPTEEIAPIEPFTLMHNHFGSDGGTTTNLTPEEFETKLRESFKYWQNKALLK